MSNKNNIKVKINIKINNFVLLEPSNISYSLFKLKNRKIWKLQCQHLNFSLAYLLHFYYIKNKF